jgi:hypothetical protein
VAKRVAGGVLAVATVTSALVVLANCGGEPSGNPRARALTSLGYLFAVCGVAGIVAGVVGIVSHRAGRRRAVRRQDRT